MKRIDKVGQRFGKLVVISVAGKNKWGNLEFLCKCDCGGEKIIASGSLRNRGTESCGCISIERISKLNLSHGLRKDSFCTRFYTIQQRCNNPKNHKFYIYGARGIKCLWESVIEFKKDMYESYQAHVKEFGVKNTSIERINNDGNYCKENCRWATYKEQGRNKTNNSFLEFNGKRYTLPEWAEITGLPYKTLSSRIYKHKWKVEEALNTPHKIKVLEYKGEKRTINEWAKILGLRRGLIALRLYRGWSIDKALTIPVGY